MEFFSFYLENIGNEEILKDRLKFEKQYRIIEKFISDNSFILGGYIGVNLLGNKPRGIYDFEYDIFCVDVLNNANELARLLEGENKPEIFGKKYNIFYENRKFANLYSIDENTDKIINPIKMKAYYEEVYVLPPEIALISIYHSLYNCAAYEYWDEYFVLADDLYKILESRDISGSAEPNFENRQEVEQFIINNWVKNSNVVLIGEHGVKQLKVDINKTSAIVQVIADKSELDSLFRVIKDTYGDVSINASEKTINVMEDFRLKKTIIRAGENQREIVYIYNSTEFELIPTVTVDKVKVGNVYVLLRFLLIDLWTIRWIRSLGKIDESLAERRQKSIIANLMKIKKSLTDFKYRFTINSDDYVGVYIDEAIQNKISKQHKLNQYK